MTTNLGTSATIFVGSHYEVTDGVVTKYYGVYPEPVEGLEVSASPHMRLTAFGAVQVCGQMAY